MHFLNAAVFHLANIERFNADLPLFGFYDNLYKSAALHSESMIEYDYFDHVNRIQKSSVLQKIEFYILIHRIGL